MALPSLRCAWSRVAEGTVASVNIAEDDARRAYEQAEIDREMAVSAAAMWDRLADKRERYADGRNRHADERAHRADQRDRLADERDRLADQRDRLAEQRDRLADERDRNADQREIDAEVSALRLGCWSSD